MYVSLFVSILKYLYHCVMFMPVLFDDYYLNWLYLIYFLIILFLSLYMPSVSVCIYDISMSDTRVLISV